MGITKKYALVTGASSGIGLEMAKQLAAKGYSLVIVARRKDRLDALASAIRTAYNVDVEVLSQDFASQNAAIQIMLMLHEKQIKLDILINNAGYGMGGRFLKMEMNAMERMFQVNMHTLVHLTQLCAKEMVKQKHGYILNVASAAAFLPSPFVSVYAATKAFVLSFSESLRYELKDTGVSITTLYPGITTTEFNDVAEAKHPPLMNLSVLSAKQVAKIGLRAMFRKRRRIVPGFINKANAFFSQVFHRGLITAVAGNLLKKANGL